MTGMARCAALFGRVIAALALQMVPAIAHASGDMGCSPQWKLRHIDLTGCDSMAMLSPGNDTRVNLALLLGRGRIRPPPPDLPRPDPLFDWATYALWASPRPTDVGDATHAAGEGSRCRSDAAGAAAFAAAVGVARQLAAAERTALIAARQALKPDCAGEATDEVAKVPLSSRTARRFAAYLQGAAAFYAGSFDDATARFGALTDDADPWLRETARYMLARVAVNRAQVGAFDEYGGRDPDHPADAKLVAAAEARLRDYLRLYPAGRYAGSARGLVRRVYWLGGETRKLAAAYAALFAQTPDARGIDDATLAEEIDTKLLPQLKAGDTTDPILLAVLDLAAMRHGDGVEPALTRADLEAQRASFAARPALFDHLLAAYAYYVAGDAREALRLLPDAARQPAYDATQFSRQMLRGMALDTLGDRNASGFWLELLPGSTAPFQRVTVELALALHEERTAGLDRVFASGSPIRNTSARDLLLTNVAGPALLRRQASDPAVAAHERAVARLTLLYKGLTRGMYRDFLTDLAALPAEPRTEGDDADAGAGRDPPSGIFTTGRTAEDFACPPLRETARGLAADPRSATGRLCLAEFVRLNDLDGFYLDAQPPADELGGTQSRFPGAPFSRLEVYRGVLAAPKATAEERAYALFRAVRCYAPSGANACGGRGVDKVVRKGWFQELHRRYPASRWAAELEYYW